MKKSSRWHITRLGELAKVERGRFSHRPRNDPSFYGGTTPFIQTGDVSGAKSGFIREFSQTLNSKGLSVSKVFPKGTLMVSIAANIGDAAELGFDSACPDSVIAITPGKALCSKYLRYYLRSRQSWIQYLAPVGTQRNINVEFLEDVEIEYPPLPEQRKIAGILSTWDETLETLDALIAAKDRQKQALMQQLLTGKTRVKGAKGKRIKAKLGELFDERVERNRIDLPLLSITADRGVVSRDELSKRDTSSEDKSKYLRIAPGDIGYNTMRMWQGVSALSALEGIVSPAYTICCPTNRIDGEFAAHFFKYTHTIHLFHRYSQGLVDDTLNLKFHHFSIIEVEIPESLAEQQQIADILDAADQELNLLRTQRQTLDQQKRGLMQRLLTGKIRVKTN
jgi:type I restriction enzyme S subunit